MKINAEIIRKFNPCDGRFNNYLKHYGDQTFDIQDFIVLENITYSDKVWVVTRLFTKEQNIKWSILCASKVLSIFEEKYPNDKRPRHALEAVEKYLNEPSEMNENAAYAAANAAHAANVADAANAAGAAGAAGAAAHTAYAAAYAAANATYAPARTAYATVRATAWAAYAAANTANEREIEEEVNLLLMLECV